MNRTITILWLLFIMCFSVGCSQKQVEMKRSDPLIGKIVDARTMHPVSVETLVDKIRSKDVIYLSEKHDNPDHHQFQEKIIQALLEKGIKPAIGFEFFSVHHTSEILNFIDSGRAPHKPKDEAFIEKDLRKKLGWDTQSDKMWGYYFSLLKLARQHQLNAAGLDLSSALKRRITRKGINGLTSIEKQQVFSTGYDNQPYKRYMFDIFKAVHCGMGNEKMQQRLYETWIARNDRMALSILELARDAQSPVIVIIGGGHTEYGLGVINRLAALEPDLSQVNIALREISVNPAVLPEYLTPLKLTGFAKNLPADFLRFSQRVSYTDPCETFARQLKRMKGRNNSPHKKTD